ncbi:hypothetical protein DH86_00002631 [Scytalidium sp. 3C]|nr:hypothetical protein DH86_00002631 [Scytalidium sp. 3C]
MPRYGPPNEHKGPPDFNGKKDMDDDDDDDASVASGPGSDHPQMMQPHFQNQPAFQHIRHQTPSASPPIPNGVPFHHQQQPPRGHTPQPPQPNGYAYVPNPGIYNPHAGQTMPPHHGLQPHMQGPPMQAQQMHGPPQGIPQAGPAVQYPQYPPTAPPPPPPQQQPHPHQQQPQQVYMEDQRRTSMPPAFPQQERPAPPPQASPPLPQQPQHQEPEPQPQPQQQQQPQQMLEPVKKLSVKSRSIFTPIDESRSILSQHWASSTSAATSSAANTDNTATANSTPASTNRSQSVDVSTLSRSRASPPPQRAQTNVKARNVSISSMSSAPLVSPSDGFTPPSRTNSASLGGGGKRPVLKVQIPEEQSDDGTGDSNSSPQGPDAQNSQAGGRRNGEHGSSVVLPPPSPSASALLSAGASGPPNPFARPHPVSQNSTNSSNSNSLTLNTSRDTRDNVNIDTPVSALPSRFMTNEFLPSPSSFYPEWNYRSGDGNSLLSPLNFATPVVGSGPSFLREDSSGAGGNGTGKRKSPDAEGDDGGDVKRSKHE